MRLQLILAVALVVVRGLSAQTPQPSMRTAASIDAAAIARHIAVIADDSMLGRDTPSRGLEQTAQYVAAQFQALGLEPVTSGGDWLQRYSLPGHSVLVDDQSELVFMSPVKRGNQAVVGEFGKPVKTREIVEVPRTPRWTSEGRQQRARVVGN